MQEERKDTYPRLVRLLRRFERVFTKLPEPLTSAVASDVVESALVVDILDAAVTRITIQNCNRKERCLRSKMYMHSMVLEIDIDRGIVLIQREVEQTKLHELIQTLTQLD